MDYLHVKDIQAHHPLYKDRDIRFVKVFLNMLDVTPEYANIVEIDKWRLVAFIMLEIQVGREVLMEEKYLTRKGFDFTQRSLGVTLTALQPLIEIRNEPSPDGVILKRIIKPKSDKDIKLENDYKEIYDYWNKQKIVIHRDYLKFRPCIKSRLEIYTVNELKEAITNYVTVLKGDEYYWSYKWTIDQFLVRKNSLDKFTRNNFNLNQYKKTQTLAKRDPENLLKELEEFEN